MLDRNPLNDYESQIRLQNTFWGTEQFRFRRDDDDRIKRVNMKSEDLVGTLKLKTKPTFRACFHK